MSKLFERLLESRGLGQDFLHPKYENLIDPFILPDLEKAVDRIKKAKKDNEKILIYGDYDVDGVTASTLLKEALTLAGIPAERIEIMLPDRFADGYGMSPRLITFAKKQDISLVITVDCGSRNHAIIDELNTLNIDTIVTDHHECDDNLPEAIAVVNPKRPDFSYKNDDLRNLAGVGVAFKLAQGLVKSGLIAPGQEKWLLDLVVIGTICDNMILTGENRILGYYGFKVLSKTRHIGLRELMKTARVKNLTTESVGFQIGPRLNVAGRLDSADISLKLLCTKSHAEAAKIAEQLEELNKKRKSEQQLAIKEISSHGVSDDPVIIEVGNWHEGILGIIAGRLMEEYKRPTFVLTELENGILKGSGRSFGDFNLKEALNFTRDIIIDGGGHSAAAGIKVDKKNLFAFREKMNQYYSGLKLLDQSRYFDKKTDLDVKDLSEFSLDFLDELKLLEPFGAGNEEPIFRICDASITNVSRMGTDQNHLRLEMKDEKGHSLKLISFYTPEKWFTLTPEDKISPLIKVIGNDYNGVKSVEAKILDIDVL